MDDTEGPTPSKRRRVSLSDALAKSKEFKSSLYAAEWAIDQFEAADKSSKNPKTQKRKNACQES